MSMLVASVIIPHFGDLTPLESCLRSLRNCENRDHVEVIVVGNNAAAISPEFTRSYADVRFIHEPNQGAAHARNAGVAHARAKVLFFTDSDCIMHISALKNMLAEAPHHDIIGGAVIATFPAHELPTAAQAFEAIFAFDQAGYIAEKRFAVTACLVTHRHVFDQTGGFQPGVSEDVDWCHRADALGFTIAYVPDIKVSHPCRETWKDLRSKWHRLTAQTYALDTGSKFRWITKACLMPLSIIAHAPRIFTSRKLRSPRDKTYAVFMLIRLRLWRMYEMLRLSFQSRA